MEKQKAARAKMLGSEGDKEKDKKYKARIKALEAELETRKSQDALIGALSNALEVEKESNDQKKPASGNAKPNGNTTQDTGREAAALALRSILKRKRDSGDDG